MEEEEEEEEEEEWARYVGERKRELRVVREAIHGFQALDFVSAIFIDVCLSNCVLMWLLKEETG